MSRSYEMGVTITGFNKSRLQKIKKACLAEWSFDEDEFSVDPKKVRTLTGKGIGSLCGGEDEEEFTDRLAKSVWKANGKYCGVEVQAVFLESPPPCEDHVRGKDDFERLMGKRKAS